MDEHLAHPADGQPEPAPVYRPAASTPPVPSPPPQIVQSPPAATPPAPMPPAPMPAVIHHAVVAKNPGVAAFLSFLWTGAGQIYNGQIGVGLALMALQVVNFVLLFVLIGFLTGFATWCFAIWHAYITAQEFNRRHGIIS